MNRMAVRMLERVFVKIHIRSAWQKLNNLTEYDDLSSALDSLIRLTATDSSFCDLIGVMVDMISTDSPMAAAFLSHIIDMAALPSQQTTRRLSQQLLSKCAPGGLARLRSKKRNKPTAALIWSVLANRLAGEMSSTLFSDQVCECLLNNIKTDPDMICKVFSIIALEKFSLTGPNKVRLMQTNIRELLQDVAYLSTAGIEDQEEAAALAQAKFCAEWSLRNVFRDPNLTHSRHRRHGSSSKRASVVVPKDVPLLEGIEESRADSRTSERITEQETSALAGGSSSDRNNTNTREITTSTSTNTQKIPVVSIDTTINTTSVAAKTGDSPPLSSLSSSSTTPTTTTTSSVTSTSISSVESSSSSLRSNVSGGASSTASTTALAGSIMSKTAPTVSTTTTTATSLTPTAARAAAVATPTPSVNGNRDRGGNHPNQVNVMLNTLDATQHWKISLDGLTIRNDGSTFESIRATQGVTCGKWYFEATVLTSGIMQVGWATMQCHFSPEEGTGIGDDPFGFAYDGCRNLIWANGESESYGGHGRNNGRSGGGAGSGGSNNNNTNNSATTNNNNNNNNNNNHHTHSGSTSGAHHPTQPSSPPPPPTATDPWRPGDILGFYLDIDNASLECFMNGQSLGGPVSPFQDRALLSQLSSGVAFYPAISATSFQQVRMNFGATPFTYAPKNLPWRNLNDQGTLTDQLREAIVRPRSESVYGVSSLYWSHGDSTGAGGSGGARRSSGRLGRVDPRTGKRLPTTTEESEREQEGGSDAGSENDSDEEGEEDEIDYSTLCTICCDKTATVILQPCGHDGICISCAYSLELCPMCRSRIVQRQMLPVKDSSEDDRGSLAGGMSIKLPLSGLTGLTDSTSNTQFGVSSTLGLGGGSSAAGHGHGHQGLLGRRPSRDELGATGAAGGILATSISLPGGLSTVAENPSSLRMTPILTSSAASASASASTSASGEQAKNAALLAGLGLDLESISRLHLDPSITTTAAGTVVATGRGGSGGGGSSSTGPPGTHPHAYHHSHPYHQQQQQHFHAERPTTPLGSSSLSSRRRNTIAVSPHLGFNELEDTFSPPSTSYFSFLNRNSTVVPPPSVAANGHLSWGGSSTTPRLFDQQQPQQPQSRVEEEDGTSSAIEELLANRERERSELSLHPFDDHPMTSTTLASSGAIMAPLPLVLDLQTVEKDLLAAQAAQQAAATAGSSSSSSLALEPTTTMGTMPPASLLTLAPTGPMITSPSIDSGTSTTGIRQGSSLVPPTTAASVPTPLWQNGDILSPPLDLDSIQSGREASSMEAMGFSTMDFNEGFHYISRSARASVDLGHGGGHHLVGPETVVATTTTANTTTVPLSSPPAAAMLDFSMGLDLSALQGIAGSHHHPHHHHRVSQHHLQMSSEGSEGDLVSEAAANAEFVVAATNQLRHSARRASMPSNRLEM